MPSVSSKLDLSSKRINLIDKLNIFLFIAVILGLSLYLIRIFQIIPSGPLGYTFFSAIDAFTYGPFSLLILFPPLLLIVGILLFVYFCLAFLIAFSGKNLKFRTIFFILQLFLIFILWVIPFFIINVLFSGPGRSFQGYVEQSNRDYAIANFVPSALEKNLIDGKIAEADEILKSDPSLINKPSTGGVYPSLFSLYLKESPCKTKLYLLDKGLQLNKNGNENESIYDAFETCPDVAKRLIRMNIALDIKGKHHGDSLLSASLETEDLELIELLLKKGLDPNQQNKNGFTPLTQSCADYRDIEVMELLLKYGGDPDLESKYGYSALKSCKDSPEKLKLLNNYI